MYQNMNWPPFSKAEFTDVTSKYNNSSTPDSDYLSWSYVKVLIKDNKYITNLVNIANSCINLSIWPTHFKKSTSIIISKLNNSSYNTSKTFLLIIFPNIISKLIEKVISNRIWCYLIALNFIHLIQIDNIKQWSTINARVYLTYLIHMEWL